MQILRQSARGADGPNQKGDSPSTFQIFPELTENHSDAVFLLFLRKKIDKLKLFFDFIHYFKCFVQN